MFWICHQCTIWHTQRCADISLCFRGTPYCSIRNMSITINSDIKECIIYTYFLLLHDPKRDRQSEEENNSKNTRVSRVPEKGPLGPNSIPGQRWPGNQSNWQIMGSDWPSSGSYFPSSWLISGHCWPRMEFGPNGPFSGSRWPACVLELREKFLEW